MQRTDSESHTKMNTQNTMNETFKLTSLKHTTVNSAAYDFLSSDQAKKVLNFHRTFPMYAETPLAHLPKTAEILGLGDIFVKDESKRFGLNAFKVLGGSYAIGSYLAAKAGLDIGDVSYELLTSPAFCEKLQDITFITATDGNHGRGVAWTAAKGMRILGNPASDDDRVVSGESGAGAFGCAAEIMTNPSLAHIRDELGLDRSSRVLFFSTEGATDTANYRSVVWDGRYPSLIDRTDTN